MQRVQARFTHAAVARAIMKIRSTRRGQTKVVRAMASTKMPSRMRGANFLGRRIGRRRHGMRRKQRRPARRSRPTGRGSLPTQRELVRDLMVASSKYGLWLTLRQLARLTGYGEASISAQLRHLRKPQYGGFKVEKRCCNEGLIGRGGDPGAVWEYKLAR